MENDDVLMSFNTWLAVQPHAEQSGLVFSASDHTARSCSVWWAGPETAFLDRMAAEARARGINLVVHPAPYSRQAVREAVELIFSDRARLARLGFDLQVIGGRRRSSSGSGSRVRCSGMSGAEQVPADLVTSVRGELAELLRDCPVHPDDVRVEYGRMVLF